MFRVGQKVVCISETPMGDRFIAPGIIINKGDIFTVRSSYRCPMTQMPGVRFHEITLPIHDGYQCEWGWEAERFRPLVEKKTDISIFEEILKRETVSDHQSSVSKKEAASEAGGPQK